MTIQTFTQGELVLHKASHANLNPPIMTTHNFKAEHEGVALTEGLWVVCKFWDKAAHDFKTSVFHPNELTKWK